MDKTIVGYGLIATVVFTFFNSIVIEPVDVILAENVYTFLGLGYVTFAVWGAILLLKK